MPATSPAKPGVSGRIDIGMSARLLFTRRIPGEGRDPPGNRSVCGSVDPGFRRECDVRWAGIRAKASYASSRSPPVAERVFAQEIEIAAAVGLEDLAAVEPGIAALWHRRRRRFAARQLVERDQEVDPPFLDRKANAV